MGTEVFQRVLGRDDFLHVELELEDVADEFAVHRVVFHQ